MTVNIRFLWCAPVPFAHHSDVDILGPSQGGWPRIKHSSTLVEKLTQLQPSVDWVYLTQVRICMVDICSNDQHTRWSHTSFCRCQILQMLHSQKQVVAIQLELNILNIFLSACICQNVWSSSMLTDTCIHTLRQEWNIKNEISRKCSELDKISQAFLDFFSGRLQKIFCLLG